MRRGACQGNFSLGGLCTVSKWTGSKRSQEVWLGPETHTCRAEELKPRLLGKGKPCLQVGKLAKTLPQENISRPQAEPPCSLACLGVGSVATAFQPRESWEPPWNLEVALVATVPRPHRLKRCLEAITPFHLLREPRRRGGEM